MTHYISLSNYLQGYRMVLIKIALGYKQKQKIKTIVYT